VFNWRHTPESRRETIARPSEGIVPAVQDISRSGQPRAVGAVVVCWERGGDCPASPAPGLRPAPTRPAQSPPKTLSNFQGRGPGVGGELLRGVASWAALPAAGSGGEARRSRRARSLWRFRGQESTRVPLPSTVTPEFQSGPASLPELTRGRCATSRGSRRGIPARAASKVSRPRRRDSSPASLAAVPVAFFSVWKSFPHPPGTSRCGGRYAREAERRFSLSGEATFLAG